MALGNFSRESLIHGIKSLPYLKPQKVEECVLWTPARSVTQTVTLGMSAAWTLKMNVRMKSSSLKLTSITCATHGIGYSIDVSVNW